VLHERSDEPATAAMLAAARLYYEDDLSQQEIAERLDVSRSTVSRLLRVARERGIVHIEIRPPTSTSRLSSQLESALGLRRAVVVGAPPRGGALQPLVAPALAELECLRLGQGDVLAVSSGATLWEIVRARRFPSLRRVQVVPALGAWDEADVRFQTNEMARRVADAGGAEVRFLHAPALPAPELRRSLLADPEIAARLALWDELTAALVGIGGPPRLREIAPSHIKAQRAELSRAVGDVAARHFDLDGSPVEPVQEVLGVSREQLRRAGTVIGAAAGQEKAASIVGAARAGLVDIVVTDAPTASAALALLDA
jgi:DNA-binding transcriptional regulator LsrR (DeoR family)